MTLPALRRALGLLGLLALPFAALPCRADELPEYRVKAAFLYNFALYTEWPAEVGGTLGLCIQGSDPFGREIDALQGKAVGNRSIDVQRRTVSESLANCQIVFITPAAIAGLQQVVQAVRGRPVLIVADSAGAARHGAALNLVLEQDKVGFEANPAAARVAGLNLSSKLLRLAAEVVP